jgi:predicted nucleic acid-binding protein
MEAEEFVRLARILDDGEALCLALAKCRGWVLATDDRKAIRVANDESVATVTTPELIKHWADSCRAENDAIATVLRNVERFARFTPRRGMLLADWWEQLARLPGR